MRFVIFCVLTLLSLVCVLSVDQIGVTAAAANEQQQQQQQHTALLQLDQQDTQLDGDADADADGDEDEAAGDYTRTSSSISLPSRNLGLSTPSSSSVYATLDPLLTWSEAEAHCEERGHRLCATKEICDKHEPIESNHLPDLNVFTPINMKNRYVALTGDNVCTSVDKPQWSQHVLPPKGVTKSIVICCSTSHGQSRGEEKGPVKTKRVNSLIRHKMSKQANLKIDDYNRQQAEAAEEKKTAVVAKKAPQKQEKKREAFRWSSAFSTHLHAYGQATGGWRWSQHPRLVGDVDGDGKADIIAFSDTDVYVSLSNGDGTFSSPRSTITNELTYYRGGWRSYDMYPRALGDVNGDGKADIVGFASNGVYIFLATGHGNFASGRHVLSSYGPQAGGWSSFDRYPRALADVNGDGKVDIVGFGNDHVYVSLSTGQGFEQPYAALSRHFTVAGTWSNANSYPRFAADVNGDGKADLIGVASDGVYVALGDGRHFRTPHLAVREYGPQAGGWSNFDTYPREVKDINGDGRADFVGFSCCSVCHSFGKEDGTFTPIKCTLKAFVPERSWSNFQTYPRMLGDINGDKRADIVGFAAQGVWASFAQGDF